jgi:NAD(P)-dependent dehydrogenase (short-subunit alcohol dehydrogenase family)
MKLASSIINLFITTAISLYTLGFLFFRIAELIHLVAAYPNQCLSAFIGTVAIQFSSIGRTSKRIIHLLTLLGIIYLVDHYLPKPLPAPSERYAGRTVVITGANSGVGFETARQLAVTYGMTVVMGCRSVRKCYAAAKTINDEIATTKYYGKTRARAIPHIVNLEDFESVQTFASQLQDMDIDVLLNNAGYAPDSGLPVNKYGLDPSFTSMHLSHFLLTEELLKQNPSLRVVNTSSGTHHICALPFTLFPNWLLDRFPPEHNPGCVDEEFLQNGIYEETDSAAYINAKIANVMHVVEIPFRHAKATSVAIDLGWVGTSIQNFMEGSFTPTSLGWMRSVNVGVLPVMHAILSSDEELLNESNSFSQNRTWKDGGVVIDVFGTTDDAFAFHWWKDGILGRSRMLELSQGLWGVSNDLIQKHTT